MNINPNDYDLVNDIERARYRSELRTAITNWRSAGSPRDAVTVAQVIEARTALSRMTPENDAERETIAHTLNMVDEVAAFLANADANATPVDAVIIENVHAECEAKIEALTERVTKLSAQVDASDPRLTEMWERAGEIADRRGYCSVYDELAEELGAPTRSVDVTARITVTRTQTFTVYVSASEVSASGLSNDWRTELADHIDDYMVGEACDEADVEGESIDWEFSSYERD